MALWTLGMYIPVKGARSAFILPLTGTNQDPPPRQAQMKFESACPPARTGFGAEPRWERSQAVSLASEIGFRGTGVTESLTEKGVLG
jgi:hypothetical protein